MSVKAHVVLVPSCTHCHLQTQRRSLSHHQACQFPTEPGQEMFIINLPTNVIVILLKAKTCVILFSSSLPEDLFV